MSVKLQSTAAKLSDAIGARQICDNYKFTFSIEIASDGENPAIGTLGISGKNWPAALPKEQVPPEDKDSDDESRFNALAALYEQKGEQGFAALLGDLAPCLETPFTIQATEYDFDEFHIAQEWIVQPGAKDVEIKKIMPIEEILADGPQSAGPDDDESFLQQTSRYFGRKLRVFRNYAGFSRHELAQRAGMVPAILANLERGARIPSAEMKRTLEGILGRSFDERPHHRQVTVQVGDWQAEIDEGIAPLIQEIWRAGIETFMSCQQDFHGWIWIQFADVKNAVAFLNVVAPYEEATEGPDTLYSRMHHWFPNHGPISNWLYELDVQDHAFDDLGG